MRTERRNGRKGTTACRMNPPTSPESGSKEERHGSRCVAGDVVCRVLEVFELNGERRLLAGIDSDLSSRIALQQGPLRQERSIFPLVLPPPASHPRSNLTPTTVRCTIMSSFAPPVGGSAAGGGARSAPAPGYRFNSRRSPVLSRHGMVACTQVGGSSPCL